MNLNGVTGPAGAPDGANPLGGILGSMLGESAAEQKTRIAEATKGANDLTSLTRRKKQPKTETVEAGAGKRKLEESEQAAGAVNAKKARVEDSTTV